MSNYNWYNEKHSGLDYSKPIVAESSDGNIQLLMPVRERGLYQIIGYDWFNLDTGDWGSCKTWVLAAEAVRDRNNYKVYNVEITLKRIFNE